MLIQANALHLPIKSESVQCVVTSPPYWGLRDYGTAQWEGGEVECDHMRPIVGRNATSTLNAARNPDGTLCGKSQPSGTQQYAELCGKCGARRIDSQLGLERTPEEYVEKMVQVFREVKRVLRKDGTVWCNLGDSYNGVGRGEKANGLQVAARAATQRTVQGLKPKDLVGIPWRIAFALQADGWYLRSDIIWAKPNPMPESVTDRPTKAHEYLFLLTKNERYFYDGDAIREPHADIPHTRGQQKLRDETGMNAGDGWRDLPVFHNSNGRNKRSVWSIAEDERRTEVITEQECPCGCGHRFGVVREAPDRPESSHEYIFLLTKSEKYFYDAEAIKEPSIYPNDNRKARQNLADYQSQMSEVGQIRAVINPNGARTYENRNKRSVWTIATQPWSGAHFATFPEKLVEPCILAGSRPGDLVLDPFAGSGTVVRVARRWQRRGVGVDLSRAYLTEQAEERINAVQVEMFPSWELTPRNGHSLPSS